MKRRARAAQTVLLGTVVSGVLVLGAVLAPNVALADCAGPLKEYVVTGTLVDLTPVRTAGDGMFHDLATVEATSGSSTFTVFGETDRLDLDEDYEFRIYRWSEPADPSQDFAYLRPHGGDCGTLGTSIRRIDAAGDAVAIDVVDEAAAAPGTATSTSASPWMWALVVLAGLSAVGGAGFLSRRQT